MVTGLISKSIIEIIKSHTGPCLFNEDGLEIKYEAFAEPETDSSPAKAAKDKDKDEAITTNIFVNLFIVFPLLVLLLNNNGEFLAV